jgi:hypothetical protein
MQNMTTRETAHALLDRYPDDELEEIVELLACRRAADGTDLSVKAILARGEARPMTSEESQAFWAEHGPHMLPSDSEG